MQIQNPLTAAELEQFTGTEQWYRHYLNPNVLFTDGAKHLAERAGAFWLVDEIAIAQRFEPKVVAEAFQAWVLSVVLISLRRCAVRTETGTPCIPRNSASRIFRWRK
jgi:hypothetical protein